MRPLYFVTIALVSLCLCGCSSRRHLADGEIAVITHASDTAHSATIATAVSSTGVISSATADVEDAHAALDSAVTETIIAWGSCPDGVVRPETIRTVSVHYVFGWERSMSALDMGALIEETMTEAGDTLITSSSNKAEVVAFSDPDSRRPHTVRWIIVVTLVLVLALLSLYHSKKL